MFVVNFDGAFGAIQQITGRKDDDWVDKLNHLYTAAILVVCAIVVTLNQYVGARRIDCWTPAHFSGSWDTYTEDYCWVKNTYKVPWEEGMPYPNEYREYIVYYQWVPFYLMIQALLYFLPITFWRAFNFRSGIDLNSLVDDARTYQNTDVWNSCDVKGEFMDEKITGKILRFLKYSKRARKGTDVGCMRNCLQNFCFSCGRKYPYHLTCMYLFTKLFAFLNIIMQLLLTTVVLGSGYLYGFNAIADFIEGSLHESARFPRVTFCDVPVRRLGNLHMYTVQCVLPINLFHEMIFLFVWFWMFAVGCLTGLNMLGWLIKIASRDRRNFAARLLQYQRGYENTNFYDDPEFKKFVLEHLHYDGVFIVRIVYENTDSMTASEIMLALWEEYVGKREKKNAERQRLESERQKAKAYLRRESMIAAEAQNEK